LIRLSTSCEEKKTENRQGGGRVEKSHRGKDASRDVERQSKLAVWLI
jgi:hypothetical protein